VLARPDKGGWIIPDLSPDGAYVLYNRLDRHPAGSQIWLVDTEAREDREILNFGADVKVEASWFSDSRRLLVLAETPSHSHKRLGIWERERPEVRWLIDDPQRNLESAFIPDVPAAAGGELPIVVVEVRGARVHASLVDPTTAEERPLPLVAGDLTPLAPLGAGVWAGTYSSSRQPTDVVRYDPKQPDPTRFVSLSRVWERTPLTPDDFTPAEDYHWRSVDGLDIQGWLYRTRRPDPLGTVVYVHGGPTAHSADAINSEIQFFAREGFHVLDPNYRGSTGFSLAFRDAIKVQGWGGIEQEDIRSGMLALIEAGIAQPGKVGITGTSYGGYSSWCAITRFPLEVLAAAAPICGMTDLVVDYETTRPDLRPYSEEMLGGSPQQVPERYRERSPIHFVGNIKGRLLIVQGERDPNVTPENVRAVRAALGAAGVPYEILTFPDEGHGIRRPANEKTLYLRLARFFADAMR
jgi:dipeptidyl aminopeptidase/acylaminoacyl peptidase